MQVKNKALNEIQWKSTFEPQKESGAKKPGFSDSITSVIHFTKNDMKMLHIPCLHIDRHCFLPH